MKPPLPPAGALASSVPPAETVPPSMAASSMMTPPRLPTVCAVMMPVLLTAVLTSCPAALAVINTVPPFASMRPPFSMRAWAEPRSMATFRRPSPEKSSVTASAAASATVPRRAWVAPTLLTCLPSSATKPPGLLIVPSLRTVLPLPEK